MSSSVEICSHCLRKEVSIASKWTQTGSSESIKTTGSQTESLPTRTSNATQTDKLTALRIVRTTLNGNVNGSSNAEGQLSIDILEREMPSVPIMQPDQIANAGDANQTVTSKSTLSTVASTAKCMHLKTGPTTSTAIVVDTRTESSLLVFNDNTTTIMNEGEGGCGPTDTNSPSAQKSGLESNPQSCSSASPDSSIQIKTSTNIETMTTVDSCIIEQQYSAEDLTFPKKSTAFDSDFSNSPKFLNDAVMDRCLQDQDTSNIGQNTDRLLADNSNQYQFTNLEDFNHDSYHSYVSTENDDIESSLPLKKRKIPDVLNNKDSDTVVLPEQEIYYPATPMLSLAELEDLNLLRNRQFGPFKTPAERKEKLPPPNLYNPANSAPNDQFNVNYCTTNYHINSVPDQFINLPSYPIVYSKYPPFHNCNVLNLVDGRGTLGTQHSASTTTTLPHITRSLSSRTIEPPSKQNRTSI